MQYLWDNFTLFYQQDKEKAKMWDFVFFDAAHFARLEQAGNPLFYYAT